MKIGQFIGLLFIVFVCSAGCSSSTPSSVDMGGEDGTKVATLVEELNEAKGDDKKMSRLFVTTPTAAEAKKFNLLSFYVTGKPTVTGSNATCKVSIEKQDGTPQGVLEWSFENTSSAWKIKTALLP
jgi:hypothetical protein